MAVALIKKEKRKKNRPEKSKKKRPEKEGMEENEEKNGLINLIKIKKGKKKEFSSLSIEEMSLNSINWKLFFHWFAIFIFN